MNWLSNLQQHYDALWRIVKHIEAVSCRKVVYMEGVSYKEIREGLDNSDMKMLKILYQTSKISKSELGSEAGVNRYKLDLFIAKLEAARLIKYIRSSENLKKSYYQITEHGQKIFEQYR